MKRLHVILTRDEKGRLHAAVEQEGKLGADLLADRVFRNVDAAIRRADELLMREFKLIEPSAILYSGPDQAAPQRSIA